MYIQINNGRVLDVEVRNAKVFADGTESTAFVCEEWSEAVWISNSDWKRVEEADYIAYKKALHEENMRREKEQRKKTMGNATDISRRRYEISTKLYPQCLKMQYDLCKVAEKDSLWERLPYDAAKQAVDQADILIKELAKRELKE